MTTNNISRLISIIQDYENYLNEDTFEDLYTNLVLIKQKPSKNIIDNTITIIEKWDYIFNDNDYQFILNELTELYSSVSNEKENTVNENKELKSLRYNNQKPEFVGISPSFLIELMKHTTYGSMKYPDANIDGKKVPNWSLGQKKSTLINSAMRHIMAYLSGELYDKDFGDSMHLTAAAWNLMVLIHQDLQPDKYKEFNDLWFNSPLMANGFVSRLELNKDTVNSISEKNSNKEYGEANEQ